MPELVPLRSAARQGHWPAVQAYFTSLDSTEKVSYAVGLLAETADVERMLEKAVADRPADPLPRTLLADRYVRIGWGIRSDLRAKHVSQEQFDQFHDWLRRAEQILIDVCAEQPAYAPAWTVRLITARGLSLGQSEARRRYDRLTAHHPHHYPAQMQLLQQLCPKWGGSWDAAHGFAREAAAAAPDGSHAGALVALAHLEHWLELDGGEAGAYMRGLPVRDDLRFAAQVSVLHSDHRAGWYGIGAHSAFALAFSLGGHFEDALPHFTALGDRASDFPWSYLPNPKSAFVKYRKSALATL
ncbi:hypothetical protein AQJ84_31200 [Streptomyces resistomycificus]|uniref:DUF4034 domain-containing protein n=1 Tax=Streptomyces resistomycificus TaxID=67356 RepID=A0A0L8LYK7_9ACTN|nr:hypothetical protein ADK37_02490 [Streptomyces resistomycificus]KUN93165.1 hypothetical protein AQJ84_31200 [Streptomyces resistomycificus]